MAIRDQDYDFGYCTAIQHFHSSVWWHIRWRVEISGVIWSIEKIFDTRFLFKVPNFYHCISIIDMYLDRCTPFLGGKVVVEL